MEIAQQIENSARWLARQQDESGGWRERNGRDLSALNTAEAIIALVDSQVYVAEDAEIGRGARYLESTQHTTPGDEDAGCWKRHARHEGSEISAPDVIRTAFAVRALLMAGRKTSQTSVQSALNWLMSRRNADRAWGYAVDRGSRLIPTCVVLLALIRAYTADPGGPLETPIHEGIKFLVERYRLTDSSFADGNPYSFQAVHTIQAIMVLQAAGDAGLKIDGQMVSRAIGWLEAHPDRARRLVEDRVPLGAPEAAFKDELDYPFLFMTDSLLMQVISHPRSSRSRRASRHTVNEVLTSLKDRIDAGGGVYGVRVFTWSTAKEISALASARRLVREFPERVPESQRLKARNGFIVLVAVLIATAGLLAFTDRFSATTGLFFTFLTLAFLLVGGFIGESSFVKLVGGLIDMAPKVGGSKKT